MLSAGDEPSLIQSVEDVDEFEERHLVPGSDSNLFGWPGMTASAASHDGSQNRTDAGVLPAYWSTSRGRLAGTAKRASMLT